MTPSVVNQNTEADSWRQQRFPHLVTEKRGTLKVSLLPSQLPSSSSSFPEHSSFYWAIWPPDLEYPGCTLLGRTPINIHTCVRFRFAGLVIKQNKSSLEPIQILLLAIFHTPGRFLRSGLAPANGLQLFKWNSPLGRAWGKRTFLLCQISKDVFKGKN